MDSTHRLRDDKRFLVAITIEMPGGDVIMLFPPTNSSLEIDHCRLPCHLVRDERAAERGPRGCGWLLPIRQRCSPVAPVPLSLFHKPHHRLVACHAPVAKTVDAIK